MFIEKDTALNDELDRLRLSATRSILERKDVVIVSSVSCIYGLGDPEEYGQMLLYLRQGDRYRRGQLLERLVEIRYERNDYDFHRGTFRVRGDVIEIYMAEAEYAVRVELWGDEIESISKFDPLTGRELRVFAICNLPSFALRYRFRHNSNHNQYDPGGTSRTIGGASFPGKVGRISSPQAKNRT